MGRVVYSAVEARRAARESGTYLLWVYERDAKKFRVPGWQELQPHRAGAVLFVHRTRELQAARRQGLL